MDVVERVALLLKAKLAEQLNATPLHQPGDWAASGGEINLTELARAAIAAVLDSMAEPSEGAGDDIRKAADRIKQLEKALRQIVLMPECMDPAADMCEIAMKALGWEEVPDAPQ